MIKEDERLLGAHMSIAGGVSESIKRGLSIGCTAIQIFTGYNNRWVSKPISPDEEKRFLCKKDLIGCIFAHNNYLINLASPDPELSDKSFYSMLDEIQRAEQLKLPFIVMHPGSHMGEGEEKGLKKVAMQLNYCLGETSGTDVRILLETTAGQGTNLGYRFEQLAYILSLVDSKDRIGICFDTCHCFAAGYDLRTQETYHKTFREFDNIIGTSRIYAFHLNDSKAWLGSRRDRHEHIGRGFLGLYAFRMLINDRRFIHTPMVLETPKGRDMKEDKNNLGLLRSLIKKGA